MKARDWRSKTGAMDQLVGAQTAHSLVPGPWQLVPNSNAMFLPLPSGKKDKT